MKKHVISALLLLSGQSALSQDLPQSAPDTLAEVIVTGEFRPQPLQTVASSISVVDAATINARNAQHLEEILALTPNVNFAAGSARARFIQIRGIGERSEFKQPINPSVGLIIDNVDFTGIGSAATLFDVEQVEVLRGPQGTRYGANALAGLINIRTNAPTDAFQASVKAGVANQNARELGAVISGPLIDGSLLGRLAIQGYKEDGAIRNIFLNRHTMDQDELTSRGRLRWLASNQLSIDVNVSHIDIDNGYDAFTLNNTRETQSDQPGRDTQRSNTAAIDALWEGENVHVRFTNAYAQTDSEYSFDEDWVFDGFDPAGYTSTDAYTRDRNNVSTELRLLSTQQSKLFADSTDWVAGLYRLSTETDLNRRGNSFSSRYETTNTAAYGELSSALSPRFVVRAGLRVEDWQADYKDSEIGKTNIDKTLVGGHIVAEFTADENQLFYLRIARGYKAGGVNITADIPNNLRPFDTEFMWNTELGWKVSALDNTLQSRVTVFYAMRDDQQVKSSLVYTDPITNQPLEFLDFITNATSGKNYGLEAELNWQATEQLNVFLNAGLLSATFDKYTAPATQAHPNGLALDGEDQAHAPRYQFSAGASYDVSENLSASLQFDGKDSFFFSDRHREKSSSYILANAQIRYQHNNWTVALWGRNLFDKDYETRGFGSFGNDPRNGYSVGRYVQFGEPRRFGISATLKI